MVDVPAVTDPTPSVLVIDRSAWGVIVVVCDAELFPGTGSASVPLTVAVFVNVPPVAPAVTDTVITHVPVAARAARLQVTAFPTLPHEPVPWRCR